MTFAPRQYQRDAVDALFAYFCEHKGNPLLVLPTGAGKSIVQKMIIEETLARWPRERFLLLTHIKELIVQNADKLDQSLVGVYSAGLGRRELGYPITVGGIQSLYKRAHEVGDISLVIIDEAHLVNKTSNSMYQGFLSDLRRLCPHVKVVGMSATPFRLDSGPLISGDMRIFTDVAYEIGIKELIELGYLAPLTSAPTTNKVNTGGVKKRGGEYIPADLERVMMEEGNTEAALDEVEKLAGDRHGWLVFCVGIDHAKEVNDAINARGHGSRIVIGDTPKKERQESIEMFKRGKLKALVSVGVLTTGFDAPEADTLVCLRPTMSPGLWVQMVGRVSRTAPGKTDGLVLDFTSNTVTHGPVDLISIDGDGNVKTAPYRICPECGELNEPRATECVCGEPFRKECPKCHSMIDVDRSVCPDCGEFLSRPREAKHGSEASDGEIISSGTPQEVEVEDWDFTIHYKEGKPPSLKITYWSGLTTYREWVCLQHPGYAGSKAALWWINNGGAAPTPKTIDAAVDRLKELTMPSRVRVKRNGKYWNVVQ